LPSPPVLRMKIEKAKNIRFLTILSLARALW